MVKSLGYDTEATGVLSAELCIASRLPGKSGQASAKLRQGFGKALAMPGGDETDVKESAEREKKMPESGRAADRKTGKKDARNRWDTLKGIRPGARAEKAP